MSFSSQPPSLPTTTAAAAIASTTAPPPTTTADIANTTQPLAATTTPQPIIPTLPLAYSQPPPPQTPQEAFNQLTAAIYGMQHQLGALALRVTALEDRSPVPSLPLPLYGMPGYGGIPAPPATAPVISELGTTSPYHIPFQPQRSQPQLPPPCPPPSTGVPITQISFPHSPSPVPSLSSIINGSRASPSTTVPIQSAPYLFHTPAGHDTAFTPRFPKLSLPIYEGTEDPLGWLTTCEQFFHGYQTRPSDRVWFASYHLKGMARQWYLDLERDSGRPEWEPFKQLCQQRFGPPFSTNHLAELARLPFTSTVEAYAELFQARAAHAGALTPLQKAQLFTGGLPEQIRADVELQEPQDLQRAVRLARAYERRNSSALLALPAPPPRAPRRFAGNQNASAPTPQSASTSASSPPQPTRTFKRLSPEAMAERRKQGLCYNYDEPYVRGHKCARLFYLEVADFVEEEPAEDDPAAPAI